MTFISDLAIHTINRINSGAVSISNNTLYEPTCGFLSLLDILEIVWLIWHFFQLLKRILEVWGDRSALKHSSYEQHKYITKAILIALAFTSKEDAAELKHGRVFAYLLIFYYLCFPLDKYLWCGKNKGNSIISRNIYFHLHVKLVLIFIIIIII